MAIIKKIEKSRSLWFLTGAFFLFFILRLPSLIEPNWYGDEGIYQVIGLALNQDRLLYSQIWDNKPPLLYLIYALANGDQFTVRFLSLVFGIASIIPFYLLTKKLFSKTSIINLITILYVLLFSTPFLEGNIANAENFMLLPIITAAFLVYKSSPTSLLILNSKFLILFLASLLLGIAFLLKNVAIFDFTAFLLFTIFISLPQKITLKYFSDFFKKKLRSLIYYIFGFFLPLILTFIYFALKGTFLDFIQAVFLGNIEYVNYANQYIFPQGFLILKIIALIITIFIIIRNRKDISPQVLFIFLWSVFSLFNALFSGRNWSHYLLVLLPATVLMFGILLDQEIKKIKHLTIGFFLILLIFLTFYFNINLTSIAQTILYYQNFVSFITNNRSLNDYRGFFDKKVGRDYEVAQFIKNKISPKDEIFIWGNNPQIYVLSHTLPPVKYTAEYHITQNPESLQRTSEDLRKSKPKYVIILSELRNFPYSLSNYVNKYNLDGTEFYERTN